MIFFETFYIVKFNYLEKDLLIIRKRGFKIFLIDHYAGDIEN